MLYFFEEATPKVAVNLYKEIRTIAVQVDPFQISIEFMDSEVLFVCFPTIEAADRAFLKIRDGVQNSTVAFKVGAEKKRTKRVANNSKSYEARASILQYLANHIDEPPIRGSVIVASLGLDANIGRSAMNDLSGPSNAGYQVWRVPINGNTYAYHLPEAFKKHGIEPSEIPT